MRETVNIYTAYVMNKSGEVARKDDVRASNRTEAARKLRVHVEDVKCVQVNPKRMLTDVLAGIYRDSHMCQISQRDAHAVRHMSGQAARPKRSKPTKTKGKR